MKFAFCLYKYFPYGGLQRDLIRFLEEAIKRGHQVKVYCSSWVGERPFGVVITLLPHTGFSNHARNKNFYRALRQELKKDSFDAIVGFNKMPGLDIYFAADSCYEAKARQDRSWLYRLSGRYRSFSQFEKAVFDRREKTQVLLISEAEKVRFDQYYHTQQERLHMLPPGICRDRCPADNADDVRQRLRNEMNLGEHSILLLFIGSAFKTKGLDRVISALGSLPANIQKNVSLVVIGEGKVEYYEQQAKNLNVADRVLFLGGRSDVPDFLLAADLLVHPARMEAAGMVLLEAMVAGLPVLTTENCGYAAYIAQAHCGVVMQAPFSQHILNEHLLNLIESSEQRIEAKQAALHYAGSQDLYSMHDVGMNLIERLTSDRIQGN